MTPSRQSAITIGQLFVICTLPAILSFPLTGPIVPGAGYIAHMVGNEARAAGGALVELVWAVTGAGAREALR